MSEASHIRSTFKHALIYSGANILAKAIGFIMLPVYAFYLRGEGYGIIGMIDVILSVMTLLIGYGISGAMRRFYFQKSSEHEKHVFVSTNITLMILMVLAVTTPAIIFSEQIAWLAFGKTGMGYYVMLALFTFIADLTARNAENYILILQKSVFYTSLSLVRLLIGLSLNIYLIVHLHLGVLGYLYSGLIVAVLFSIVMHGYALCHVGFHFRPADVREILAFSLPLLPGYVAMFFRNNTDRIMLRTYLGLAQLGAFEMLFKFATLIGVFVSEPFMKSWDIKRFEISHMPEGPSIMARVFTYQLALNMFVGLILALEIPILLRILTPQEFWLSGGLAFLAVSSRIILDSYYQFFFGLLHTKRTSYISMIQFVTAGLSVLLNWLLIKRYGLWGAVMASCVVNGIQSALGYVFAQRYYRIPYEWSKVVTILCLTCTLFFLIDMIELEGTPVEAWLTSVLHTPVSAMLHMMHIDAIKNGKIAAYFIGNIPIIFEGGIKLVLAFAFLLTLPLCGIVPRQLYKNMQGTVETP